VANRGTACGRLNRAEDVLDASVYPLVTATPCRGNVEENITVLISIAQGRRKVRVAVHQLRRYFDHSKVSTPARDHKNHKSEQESEPEYAEPGSVIT
jgi:hypothetical protein